MATSPPLEALCAACVGNVPSFAYWLPKVELHAHLNGSISMALLRHLAKKKAEAAALAQASSDGAPLPSAGMQLSMEDDALEHITNPKDRMAFCFQVFDRVYQIMDNLSFTRLAVQDVCLHYAAEHTIWLELRTSLRDGLRCDACPTSDAVTQEAYLTTVQTTLATLISGSALYDWNTGEPIDVTSTHAMEVWKAQLNKVYASSSLLPRSAIDVARRWLTPSHDASSPVPSPSCVFDAIVQPNLLRMRCCLTVSISRSLPLAAAHGTLAVVERLLSRQLQGGDGSARVPITSIDFSGNCYKQCFRDFVPLLRQLREQWSLRITLHAGEKEDDEELEEMIHFGPDRWGHLVFASNAHRTAIGQSSTRSPIELCPSSNLLTCGHTHMDQHHMKQHWNVGEYLALAQSGVTGEGGVSALSSAPISINTDDRGVFGTSMTEELLMVASLESVRCLEVMDVQRLLFALQRRALEDAFVGQASSRGTLLARFDDACNKVGLKQW